MALYYLYTYDRCHVFWHHYSEKEIDWKGKQQGFECMDMGVIKFESTDTIKIPTD